MFSDYKQKKAMSVFNAGYLVVPDKVRYLVVLVEVVVEQGPVLTCLHPLSPPPQHNRSVLL